MSAEQLIGSLEKLIKLHKSLLDLSIKKTEVIKKGDMDALNQIMKDEQAHVSAIQNIEQTRGKAAKLIAPSLENPSATDCLPFLQTEQQIVLQNKVDALKDIVWKVKDQNYFNQQLLHQSMQFLNFSVRLIQPVQENINYERPDQKNITKNGTGLFNFKA